MSQLLIAQLIGLSALILCILIFQMNERKNMLMVSMSAALLFSIHFLLLGAFTGAAMSLIGAVRGFTFIHVTPNKRHTWVLMTFLVLAGLATLVTWQGYISLFAYLASSFGTFATWHTKPKFIRRWALAGPPLWFVYSAASGSYPGMMIEVIMLSSNLIGEYRYDFKHTKHIRRRLARAA